MHDCDSTGGLGEFGECVCVCVCVCARERERERETAQGDSNSGGREAPWLLRSAQPKGRRTRPLGFPGPIYLFKYSKTEVEKLLGFSGPHIFTGSGEYTREAKEPYIYLNIQKRRLKSSLASRVRTYSPGPVNIPEKPKSRIFI